MKRWVVLVAFRSAAEPKDVQSWLAAANGAEGRSAQIVASSADANLPGSVSDCDAVWDLTTRDDSMDRIPALKELFDAACVASTESLALVPIAFGYQPLAGTRIKRTLALTVRNCSRESEIQRFERSLQAMARHIPEIRSWALSRVDPAFSNAPWTHVWEQEYAEVAGLRGAYMQSPYHWAGVDRWFDPEVPCSIVEQRMAHMFRWAERPVLAL